jgi:glycosyltransferase involved in cell wall biosynthesis
MARVLAVEPFYGGSHRSFIDGLIERSRHRFHLITLPASFWKWRMRGAAITLSDKARKIKFRPDLLFASDMLSLADFKALYGDIPSILYMHENQLSYPVPASDQRDAHFGFTNITSCLAADSVVWNSEHHRDSFFAALPGFINMMPDHQPSILSKRIREKSRVIHPGVDLESIDDQPLERDQGPPIILWNHRWEFDKKPELFFRALEELDREGLDFRIAVLGENFQVKPRVFLEAGERFSGRIAQFGFVEDRAEYVKWLRRSSISISCAEQENFGIAAVEAAYAGARPLWPDRLSYPELIPPDKNHELFYSDFSELVVKLKAAVSAASSPSPVDPGIADALRRFDWQRVIDIYDDLIEETAA